MYGLEGRKGIVTAASTGIGRAVAEVLSREGVELMISSSNAEKIDAAARGIYQITGTPVHSMKCDLKVPAEVKSLAESSLEKMGSIDYIVINFGDPKLDQFLRLDEKDWSESINMFIGTTVTLIRSLVPRMTNTGGRIILITSMTTRQAVEGFALSGALRAAVVNLGKILSLELAPIGITVNSISQGYFNTNRLSGVLQRRARLNGTSVEEELEKMKSEVPVRRIGEPEEIGKLVSFLCSDDASYINGANIPIDGGVSRYPY